MVVGSTGSSDGDVSTLNGGKDFWVFKLTSEGQLIWEKTFGGSGDEKARDVAIDSEDNIIVGGFTLSNDGDVSINEGYSDGWVISVSSEGELLWEKSTGGTNYDFINTIFMFDDSSVISSGLYQSYDDNPDSNIQGGGGGFGWSTLITNIDNKDFDDCVRLSYSHVNGMYPNPTTGILNIKEQLPENTSYAVYNSH